MIITLFQCVSARARTRRTWSSNMIQNRSLIEETAFNKMQSIRETRTAGGMPFAAMYVLMAVEVCLLNELHSICFHEWMERMCAHRRDVSEWNPNNNCVCLSLSVFFRTSFYFHLRNLLPYDASRITPCRNGRHSRTDTSGACKQLHHCNWEILNGHLFEDRREWRGAAEAHSRPIDSDFSCIEEILQILEVEMTSTFE